MSVADKCWKTGTSLASLPSPWARYGCDPSYELIDAMLTRFIDKFGIPDVLFVTGDHTSHGISPHRGK